TADYALVVVANGISSDPITFPTATSPPIITVQPKSQTLPAGTNVTFTIAAAGSSLSYFWRRNGLFIPGATNSSYTTNNVQVADSGAVFSCLVSNSTGTTLSSNAVLTVVLTPANDLCDGAFVITNYPYSNTQSTAYATSQGDPTPRCSMFG